MLTRPLSLPANPWLVLWAVAISGAWLLPTHLIPWHGFHADLLMVMALLPAALWATLHSSQRAAIPVSAVAALCVAVVPPLQFAGGLIQFAGDAWIASAYLFAFGVSILVGTRLEQVAPGVLMRGVFAAFAVAAILSTGLALYQLLRGSGLGLLTIEFPYSKGYRPFANLGQPNHLATLLVWGLIGLWWLYLSGRARAWVVVGAAAFLLIGIAATQSRTAWLQVTLLVGAAAVYRRPLALRRSLPGLLALAALFVVLTLTWGSITRTLSFEAVRTLSDEMSPGLRPAAWKLFADTVARHPWAGWGWNQIPVAQSAVALDHPGLGYTFQSTHNLVLDLLVQNGLPLGLLMAAGLAAWFVSKARTVDGEAGCLLLVAVAVLLVHAMLEFPQAYAYFLLPAGLMMGALDALHPWGPRLHVKRPAVIGALCLGALLAGWIAVEYNMAERSLERVRFERARVGPSRNSQAPDLLMLTQLREFLRFLRLRYSASATAEELEAMRHLVERYPSDGNHLALAVAAASNGDPKTAGDTLARMCRMVPPPRCEQALASWRQMAKGSPALADVDLGR